MIRIKLETLGKIINMCGSNIINVNDKNEPTKFDVKLKYISENVKHLVEDKYISAKTISDFTGDSVYVDLSCIQSDSISTLINMCK